MTYLQHATPAAFYAHVGNRGETEAITRDMLSSGIDVMLGGGWRNLQKPCDEGGTYAEAFARRGYRVVQSLDEAEEVSSGRLLCVVDEKELELRMRGASGQARAATETASAAGVPSGVARMAQAMAWWRASAQLSVAILSA